MGVDELGGSVTTVYSLLPNPYSQGRFAAPMPVRGKG
jgi:hypothetical protein